VRLQLGDVPQAEVQARPRRRSPRTKGERIRCDAEDGCVWLHLGDSVAPMTPRAARDLGEQMRACADAAEKQR
jgi:hypothetical protein